MFSINVQKLAPEIYLVIDFEFKRQGIGLRQRLKHLQLHDLNNIRLQQRDSENLMCVVAAARL